MSAGRGGATPNPQVRREEVICNDIKLLSSLSAAASACLTYPSTADPRTSQLQTRGMCCLMHSVAVCVCVCVCMRACVRVRAGGCVLTGLSISVLSPVSFSVPGLGPGPVLGIRSRSWSRSRSLVVHFLNVFSVLLVD